MGVSVCFLCCCIEEYRVTCNMDKFSNVFSEGCVVLHNRLAVWNLVYCSRTFLKVCSLLLDASWNVLEYYCLF